MKNQNLSNERHNWRTQLLISSSPEIVIRIQLHSAHALTSSLRCHNMNRTKPCRRNESLDNINTLPTTRHLAYDVLACAERISSPLGAVHTETVQNVATQVNFDSVMRTMNATGIHLCRKSHQSKLLNICRRVNTNDYRYRPSR